MWLRLHRLPGCGAPGAWLPSLCRGPGSRVCSAGGPAGGGFELAQPRCCYQGALDGALGAPFDPPGERSRKVPPPGRHLGRQTASRRAELDQPAQGQAGPTLSSPSLLAPKLPRRQGAVPPLQGLAAPPTTADPRRASEGGRRLPPAQLRPTPSRGFPRPLLRAAARRVWRRPCFCRWALCSLHTSEASSTALQATLRTLPWPPGARTHVSPGAWWPGLGTPSLGG